VPARVFSIEVVNMRAIPMIVRMKRVRMARKRAAPLSRSG
jgi:hypothetical protein